MKTTILISFLLILLACIGFWFFYQSSNNCLNIDNFILLKNHIVSNNEKNTYNSEGHEITYWKKDIIIDSNKYKLEYWKDEAKNMELIKFYDMFYIKKNEKNKIRIIPIGKIISSLKEEERDKILNNGGYKKEVKKYTDLFCEAIKQVGNNQN